MIYQNIDFHIFIDSILHNVMDILIFTNRQPIILEFNTVDCVDDHKDKSIKERTQ